jgi:hypothetical protein
LPNSAGVLPTGSAPSERKRSRVSGSFRIFTVSALSRSITLCGVPVGTNMPNHAFAS